MGGRNNGSMLVEEWSNIPERRFMPPSKSYCSALQSCYASPSELLLPRTSELLLPSSSELLSLGLQNCYWVALQSCYWPTLQSCYCLALHSCYASPSELLLLLRPSGRWKIERGYLIGFSQII